VIKIFDGVTGNLVHELRPYTDFKNYRRGVELAIGDVNGDGWNDLVVSPTSADVVPVRVYSSAPADHWSKVGKDFLPYNSKQSAFVTIAVADQNVGGAPNLGHIVVGSTTDGQASIASYVLNQNGSFGLVPDSRFEPFGTDKNIGMRIATGDINGDGIDDII